MWLGIFSGNRARADAEEAALQNKGYSVNLNEYLGVRPALSVYSDINDLLHSDTQWVTLIDNFLPMTWLDYRNRYLTQIAHGGFIYWVRACYHEYGKGEAWELCLWSLIVESPPKSGKEYNSQPMEIDELDEQTRIILKNKFLEFTSS